MWFKYGSCFKVCHAIVDCWCCIGSSQFIFYRIHEEILPCLFMYRMFIVQVLFSHPVLTCVICINLCYFFIRMLMKYLLETSVHCLGLTVLVETHSQIKIIVAFLW